VRLKQLLAGAAIDQHRLGDRTGGRVDDPRAAAAADSEVTVAEGEEGDQHGAEVAAALGQQVFVARRPLAVEPPLEHARVHQGREPARQHVRGNAEALLELVEPGLAGEGVAQDQHAPPLADLLEAAGDRTSHVGEALALHRRHHSLVTCIMKVTSRTAWRTLRGRLRPAVTRPPRLACDLALLAARRRGRRRNGGRRGALAAVPVIRECDETGGDIAVTRLEPPTIYVCPRVVELARKADPGVEHFYLVHEYGTSPADGDEAAADCWAGARAGEGAERRALPGGGDPPLPRRGEDPSRRYGTPLERAERIRSCAEAPG
jgi:hypothetical protein